MNLFVFVGKLVKLDNFKIVALGLRETLNACGANVSHYFGAVRVEARIPPLKEWECQRLNSALI